MIDVDSSALGDTFDGMVVTSEMAGLPTDSMCGAG